MAKHHPGARKVHRQTQDDDAFVSGVLETSVWAKQHGRTVVIASVVTLLLLAGILYYRNYRSTLTERAAQELSQIRATVQSGNLQLAQQDLEKFVGRFGSTPSGEEARLLLAQVRLQNNEAPKAIDVIEDLTDDVESPLGYNAALLLGAAHEQAKQLDQAERVYLRVADDARFPFQRREALDRAARIRLERGNLAGAAELYERALESFDDEKKEDVNEEEKRVIEMRLAEVRAAQQGARS